MKRVKLYSEEQAQLEVIETFEQLSDKLEDKINEELSEFSKAKDEKEEVDYYSVSPRIKRQLISFYIRNRHKYYSMKKSKKPLSVDEYIKRVYYSLGQRLYALDKASEELWEEAVGDRAEIIADGVRNLTFGTMSLYALLDVFYNIPFRNWTVWKDLATRAVEALGTSSAYFDLAFKGTTVGFWTAFIIASALGLGYVAKKLVGIKDKMMLKKLLKFIQTISNPTQIGQIISENSDYNKYISIDEVMKDKLAEKDIEIANYIKQGRPTYTIIEGNVAQNLSNKSKYQNFRFVLKWEIKTNERGQEEWVPQVVAARLDNKSMEVNEYTTIQVAGAMALSKDLHVKLSTSVSGGDNNVIFAYSANAYDFLSDEIGFKDQHFETILKKIRWYKK